MSHVVWAPETSPLSVLQLASQPQLGLAGVRVDAMSGGGFGKGEQALFAEALAVGADDVVDDEPVERVR